MKPPANPPRLNVSAESKSFLPYDLDQKTKHVPFSAVQLLFQAG